MADAPVTTLTLADGAEVAPVGTLRRNIVAIYGAYVINGVLSVVVVPLALRQFGSDGYGLYAIYGVLTLCCNLLGMGMHKHFTRLLASDRDATSQSAHLRVFLAMRLTISAVLLLLLPVLALTVPVFLFPVGSQDVSLVRWLVALAVVEYLLATPTDVMTFLCIANERIDRYSTFVVVSGLYRYALMFVGVLVFGTPLLTVALLVARRLIDPWVGHYIMAGYPARAWRPRFDLGAFREALRGSAMLSLSEIGQIGMLSLGSVLANAFCGLGGLGLYRAAFDLTSRLWMISNGLGLVVFPRFTHLLAVEDRSAPALARMSSILNMSWAGYLVVCTLGAWAAPSILPLLGLQPEAIQLFMLLLLGTGINAHGTLSYQFLLAAGKYLRATFAVGLGIVALAATFAVLQPHLGILALGWGWMVSQLAYAVAVDVEARWLAGDSPTTVARQVAFKLVVALAAGATGAHLVASAMVAAMAPTMICFIALVLAVYGLRAAKQPSWEKQNALMDGVNG